MQEHDRETRVVYTGLRRLLISPKSEEQQPVKTSPGGGGVSEVSEPFRKGGLLQAI